MRGSKTKSSTSLITISIVLLLIFIVTRYWNQVSNIFKTTEPFATGCDFLSGLVGSLDGGDYRYSQTGQKTRGSGEPRALKWSKNPTNRVVGGYKDSSDQWVCQGTINGSVIPGRTWDQYGKCNVANGDVEVAADDFTYLDGQGSLYWTKYPARKVQGGIKDNNKLYVCHGDVNGDKYIGATWNTHPFCEVGVDGKSKSLSDFEYLSRPGNNKRQTPKPSIVQVPHLDNWGSDFRDFDSTQDVCKSTCLSTPACNIASHNGGHCWLKTGIDPNNLKRSDAVTSLIKMTTPVAGHEMANTDYPNGDFARIQTDSLSDCKAFCQPLKACKAVAYDSSGSGSCWMKSATGEGVVNHDRQSWLK